MITSILRFMFAFIIFIFKDLSFNLGDTYLLYDELANRYRKQYDDFDEILKIVIDDGYLICEENCYYLKQDYYDEKLIADYLINHNIDDLKIDEVNLDKAIEDSSYFEEIVYDSNQILAIKNFFDSNISMIVGGPGTGKTTIIKAMVNLFTNYFPYNNIVVIAPTGRAAKRINEICAVPSKTIHSLLRWNKEDNSFAFNEANPLLYDAVIIDEFSMVDCQLHIILILQCEHNLLWNQLA